MIEYKEYFSTTVGYDDITYDTRATLYLEDGKIHVMDYQYMDADGEWQHLDESHELAKYLNENYQWDQL